MVTVESVKGTANDKYDLWFIKNAPIRSTSSYLYAHEYIIQTVKLIALYNYVALQKINLPAQNDPL